MEAHVSPTSRHPDTAGLMEKKYYMEYNSNMDYNKLALELHKKYKGKITTSLRDQEGLDRDKLSS